MARSTYASPCQSEHGQQRAASLREALARNEDLTPTNPLMSPAALRSRAGASGSPAGRQRTPRTDAARQRVDASMRASPFTSPFVQSPITRSMRQAPLGGTTPLGCKRKTGAPLETPPSTRPRRTLADTLPQTCLTDLQPSKRIGSQQQGWRCTGLRQCPTFAAGTNVSTCCKDTLLEAPLSTSAHMSAAAAVPSAPSTGVVGGSRGPRRSLQPELDMASDGSRLLGSGELGVLPAPSTLDASNAGASPAPETTALPAAAPLSHAEARQRSLQHQSSSSDVEMAMDIEPVAFATSTAPATMSLPQAAAVEAMGAADLQQARHAGAAAPPYCRTTMQLAAAVQSSIEHSARRRLAAALPPPMPASQAAVQPAPRPPLPPGAAERLPPRPLSRAGSLSGGMPQRCITPTAASPTGSVCTPAGVPPLTLQVPGAPMKKGRDEGGDANLLAGRMSSLSVDSLEATGVSTLSSASPCWSPREGSPRVCRPITRRMLVFPDLPAGMTP